MSDSDKPIFFGGLPPRETAETSPVVVDDAQSSRRLPRRMLLTGVGVAGVAIVVAVAVLVLPQVFGASQPTGPAPAATMSAEEQAAADAAIAEGGGAVVGHIVSGELCDAIDAFVAAGDASGDAAAISPETLAAMEVLAAVESPYQEKYQVYVAMTKDLSSITSAEEAQAIASDFAHAVQVDVTTCA